VAYLLDTHILIWLFAIGDGASPLPPRVKDLVSDGEQDIVVSVVSLWEIALKSRIGKLQVALTDVTQGIETVGFRRLDLRDSHLLALTHLPLIPEHRDPFDHLLIAQAVAEDLVFVSLDRWTPRYPVRVLAG